MNGSNNESLISNELNIDPAIQEHMADTAKWAKFVSIAGFIFSGMIIVAVFVYIGQLNNYDNSAFTRSSKLGLTIAGLFYLLIPVAWIITSVFQYRFAVKLQFALAENNQPELEASMKNLKIYYRISGIITILSLLLGCLAILGMLTSY